MAKIRMRSRHPDNKNTKVTVVHSSKSVKLRSKIKLMVIALSLSVLLNVYLAYIIKA